MPATEPVLRIAPDLALPLDAVTETFLIFGKRGSGKTTTSVVLTEEMIGAGLPVCVLDPMGAWWGLRSSADGNGPGLPVTILGGEHADLPLSPDSGIAVADLLAAERMPLVLDMFSMSKTQQRTFVTDFMERLFRKNREPLHLVIDEADRFAPQRGSHEGARLLGAYEDIVLRGRKPGIGSTSITLRPAQLHSAIRSQVEVLIAMRLLGKLDVQAIDEWVRLHATEEEAQAVKASLPSLPVGTAWFWSPAWLEILSRVEVRPRRTFDSSATPKVGQRRIVPREFARVNPADLERLAARLGPAEPAVPPAAKPASGDTARLRAELQSARAQLAEARAKPAERVEVPVLAPGDIAALEQAITALQGVTGGLEIALSRAVRPVPQPRIPVAPSPPRNNPRIIESPSATSGAVADASLSKAQRAILTVLAQFPDGRTKIQLSLLSGYSVKSSGFSNALGGLRSAGLINRGNPIQITPAGIAAVGDDWEPLPSGEALVQHWMGQLGKAERAILGYLLDSYPETRTKEEVSAATGYSQTSSGFSNALGRLRALELINRGPDMAADETFAREVGHA
jgi:hypothetical protein